jgi:hypothetical protein
VLPHGIILLLAIPTFGPFDLIKWRFPSGHGVLELPQWILFIRIAQAVVALVAFYSFDGDGLMLFTVRVSYSSFSSY